MSAFVIHIQSLFLSLDRSFEKTFIASVKFCVTRGLFSEGIDNGHILLMVQSTYLPKKRLEVNYLLANTLLKTKLKNINICIAQKIIENPLELLLRTNFGMRQRITDRQNFALTSLFIFRFFDEWRVHKYKQILNEAGKVGKRSDR